MEDRHARHRTLGPDRRRRPVDGFRARTTARFDQLVDEAVRGLPPALHVYLDGLELAVADVPPRNPRGDGEELVLSAVVPGDGPLRGAPVPDRLVLFRRPLEVRAHDRHDLVDLIRHTVVDELADRHGLDDDQLGELGWP